MRRATTTHVSAVAALALLAGCTPTPTILPSNSFNRPADMTFVCLGAFGQQEPDGDGGTREVSPYVVSARPMSVCHTPPVADKKMPQTPASIQNRTFALVANSASGDLSVIDADIWKIVDMNKSTGGYGRVPLGSLPEQISLTSDGCRLVSANRGSCDLSLVDPSTLLAPVFAAQYNSASTGVSVNVPSGSAIQRVVPHHPGPDGTPLGAAPYEAVFLPRDTSQAAMCPIDGAAPTTPWRALVTFPSCNLIALIDLPSGDIVSSVRAVPTKDAKGRDSVELQDAGTAPVCANDCGSGRSGAVPDAGVDPDGGGGTPAGTEAPRPTGIAITPNGARAYVSFSNVPALLPISLTTTAIAATEPLKGIALNEGARGSNRIRLGVDPYSVRTSNQGFPGRFVGDNRDRAYLYVIARDGSLRIIDVFVPGEEKECETNFDALDPYLAPTPQDPTPPRPSIDANNRCIEYGTVNRRPYSNDAAGLRFPTFPIDVAAADMGREGDQREDTVNGGYAWVLTASGLTYLVNIDPAQRSIKAVVHQSQKVLFDPDPATVASYQNEGFVYKNDPVMGFGVQEAPPFPNRPRDRNFLSYSASLDGTLGLVRLNLPPIALATGPYIEPIYTQGTEDNSTAVDAKPRQTYVFFPDRDGAVPQGWDVVWQGTIVSPRYSGVLRGTTLKDGGGGFCSAGVLAGDIVTLNGCNSNSQCPLGMVCQRDTTLDQVPGGLKVTGLCVSSNLLEAHESRCAPYVSSVRRYEVVRANNTELALKPHLDEMVRSSLTPCQPGRRTSGVVGAGGAAGSMCAPTGGTGGGAAGAGGAAGTGGAAATGGAAGTGGAGGAGGAGGMTVVDDVDEDCEDPIDGSTSNFKCVELDGQRRCLDPCTRQQDCRQGRVCPKKCQSKSDCASDDCAPDGMCRTGRTCITNADCTARTETCVEGFCEINSYCTDGPELAMDACFPQLTAYQVNVGAGFMVTGTQAGSFAYGIETEVTENGQTYRACAPDPSRDPRLVSRIPLRPSPGVTGSIQCDDPATMDVNEVFPTLKTDATMPTADGFFINRFDPRIAPKVDATGRVGPLTVGGQSITQEAPQLVDWMDWTKDVSAPNACIYMAGPVISDSPSDEAPLTRECRPQHARARFRNTQVGFVIANIDRAPAGASTLHFDVQGGFRPQFVVAPSTVEISAPARIVLGPIDSNQEAKVTAGPAPYFFIVDQRRLGRGQGGGATRGQIVRVNPYGLAANGYLPIYEDYSRSGNTFPIQ